MNWRHGKEHWKAGFFNVQFYTKCAVLKSCAVLMKKTVQFENYFVTQGFKKINSSKMVAIGIK